MNWPTLKGDNEKIWHFYLNKDDIETKCMHKWWIKNAALWRMSKHLLPCKWFFCPPPTLVFMNGPLCIVFGLLSMIPQEVTIESLCVTVRVAGINESIEIFMDMSRTSCLLSVYIHTLNLYIQRSGDYGVLFSLAIDHLSCKVGS